MEKTCENCKYQFESETGEHCSNCIHAATENFQPITNGDWLRFQDNNYIAEIFGSLADTNSCTDGCFLRRICEKSRRVSCEEAIIKWLNEPRGDEL